MGILTDARKAVRLIARAAASRSAARRLRSRLKELPALEEGKYKIAVYFADSDVNIYQMRQWYAPMQQIAKRWPVVVLARSARGVEALMNDGELPVAYAPKVTSIEKFLPTQDIRIVFYVNQNTRNFQMFRYGRRWHVFINHGESDKIYMVSNQFKSYDYAFIAGEAARQRLSRALWKYDLDERTIEIGRPQADHFHGTTPYDPDDRTVVLYAPTWEGDRPTAHYGSVVSHGTALVKAVLGSRSHRLIYRPHPRSGAVDPAYGAANRAIIQAIEAANAADASAHHVYDDGPSVGWQLAAADVAILDVSAMIYDRLATGKPLLVARPVDERASVDENGYLSDAEWLSADRAAEVLAEVERVRSDSDATGRLALWSSHYFGDTTPGVASAKWEAAVERLMDEWDEWHQSFTVDEVESDDDDEEQDEDAAVKL